MHFKTDSNNTIVELTNDYSKGGNSGSKINNNHSCFTSHISGEKLQSQSQIEPQNLHLSLVMKPSEDVLVTPRKLSKINNDFLTKNMMSNSKKPIDESPFVQIGTKIKSIFGNFFKT